MWFSTEWFELMIDNKPCSSLFSGASAENKRRKTKLSTVLQSFYLKTILKSLVYKLLKWINKKIDNKPFSLLFWDASPENEQMIN